MKKLINAAGRQQATLAPKQIAAPFVTKFARSQTARVCNASSKEAYKTPKWPSARVSAADGIKSRGWA